MEQGLKNEPPRQAVPVTHKSTLKLIPSPLRGRVRERGKLPLYRQVVATPTPNPSRKGRGVFQKY
jgi:hypothetical protein